MRTKRRQIAELRADLANRNADLWELSGQLVDAEYERHQQDLVIVALADEVERLKALPHVRRDCRDCRWWAPYDDDPELRSGVCRPLHQQTMARFGGCDDHYLAREKREDGHDHHQQVPDAAEA
jgi:hypothetical protein